ncbi:MAG: eriC [Anaerocolumna sp.]|nr:eriC [Anaerocolumna sp.]
MGVAVSGIIGLPIEFTAALGYIAVFGSATNTMIAPIFIGAEVFGYEYIPYFFVIAAIAYVFNGNKSIYSAQKTY